MSGDLTSVPLAVLVSQAKAIATRLRTDHESRELLREARRPPEAMEQQLAPLLVDAWAWVTRPAEAEALVEERRAERKRLAEEGTAWVRFARRGLRLALAEGCLDPEVETSVRVAWKRTGADERRFPTIHDIVRDVLAELRGRRLPEVGREVVLRGEALLARFDAHEEAMRRAKGARSDVSKATNGYRNRLRTVLRHILVAWEHAVDATGGRLRPLDLDELKAARAQAVRRRKAREDGGSSAA